MYKGRIFVVLQMFVAVNILFNSPTNAGVVKRSIRMVREVYPPDVEPENDGIQPQVCIVGDVVYGADEAVPAEQPCLKCRCQPPGVQCETVQCAKKPGCKAIHRPNKCCPDYQCECDHNGHIFANGEKLKTNPGGECKVCYCRGGELQCTDVSCYIRTDCEGKRVPGKCCPKYDHCPPIDPVHDRSTLTTEPPQNTLKPVILELWQESTFPNSTELSNTPAYNPNPEDTNKVPDAGDLATASPIFEEIPKKDAGMLPRITIQEIIPERKEIPITAPPKSFGLEPQGTLLIEEALPASENTSNDLNVDSEPESSEVSEIFQHPPPVLRIGDKLLFLKKGEFVVEKDTSTPQSVITIIGAEGLQRGGFEESGEVHEFKIYPEYNRGKEEDKKDGSESNDLELNTAESTHILSLLKKKKTNQATTTTQEPITAKEEEMTTLTSIIDIPSEQEPLNLTTEASMSSETMFTVVLNDSDETNQNTSESTTLLPPVQSSEQSTESLPKNTEPIIEQNPAYPILPDAMPAVGDVSQKFEIELENDNSTIMEIKILPEIFDFVSNKTDVQKNASYSEWLKKNNETLINYKAALPEELLNQRSPIDEDESNSTISDDLTTVRYEDEKIVQKSEEILDVAKNISEASGIVVENQGSSDDGKIFSVKEHSKNIEKEIDNIKEMSNLKEVIALEESSKSFKGEYLNPSKEPSRSIESLEVEDSGEHTTPKSNHSSLISNENASIEKVIKEDPLEASDMIPSGIKEASSELASSEASFEVSTKSVLAGDVEIIYNSKKSSLNDDKKNGSLNEDVEFINIANVPSPTKVGKIESSTFELLPTPEESGSKVVLKRDVSSEDVDDEVFKNLEKELVSDSTEQNKSVEEEETEADEIFKDLLDEAKGPIVKTEPKTKDEETAEKVSNALASIALGKQVDAGIFGLIGNLFGSQGRQRK